MNEIYIDASVTNWNPTTERGHIYAMKKYVLDAIGRRRIKNVNNIIVQRDLIDPLIKRGFKEGSLMSIYRRLNAVFMFAVKNEMLDRKRFSTPNLKGAVESVKRDTLSVDGVTKTLEIARTKY